MSHRLRVVVDRKPVVQPDDATAAPLDKLKEPVDGCPRGAITLIDEEGRIVWS